MPKVIKIDKPLGEKVIKIDKPLGNIIKIDKPLGDNISIKDRAFTPISKQLTGKSLAERTPDFLEESAKKLTRFAGRGVGQTKEGTFYPKPRLNTFGFYLAQNPGAVANVARDFLDLTPADIGILLATSGAAKIPVGGTTLGRVASKVPFGLRPSSLKKFFKGAKELGRLEKTLRPFKGQIAAKTAKFPNMIRGTKELDRINQSISPTVERGASVQLKKNKFGRVETEIIDRYAPVRHLQQTALKHTGREIPFKELPYEKMRLISGVGGMIEDKIIQYGRPLRGLNKKDLDVLRQIKAIQRMGERAVRGFKNPNNVTSKDATAALGQIKSIVGDRKYRQLLGVAEQQRRILRRVLAKAKGGFLGEDDYKKIISENEFYTPFEIIDYVQTNLGRMPAGKRGLSSVPPKSLKAIKGTTKETLDPIQAEMRYISRMVPAIENNKAKQNLVNMRKWSASMKDIIIPKGEDAPSGYEKIYAYTNGIKETFYVPKEISDVVKGLNQKSIDLMTQWAGKSARALRAGATQFNLAFIVSNMLRDFQQAKLTSDYGFSLGSWMSGLASAIKKDSYYRLWMRQGGAMSGIQQILRRTTPATVSELNPTISRRVATWANPAKWVSKLAELSEVTTRTGIFKRGIKLGKHPLEAALMSRNASIDFASMGNTMQMMNLWIPFLNARTQGTLNVLKAAKKRPVKFSMSASGIIGIPAMATYFWNKTQFPDVYKNISQFEKDNNFMFIYGRRKDDEDRYLDIVKIPKGDVGRVIGNPVENFLEYLSGADPNFGATALKVLSDVSPLGFEREGKLSGSALMASGLPPTIKGIVEGATNKNLYTDRGIVPRSIEKASPAEQYTEDTSILAIKLGQLFNISPMKIENFFGTQFGGVGRQVMKPEEFGETFTRRFKTAYGKAEQDRQYEIVEAIERETTDKRAKATRLARQAAEQFKTLPPDTNIRKQWVKKTFKGEPKAVEKFLDYIVAEQKGEKPIHRTLKRMPIKDRVKFLMQYIPTLDSPEEKLETLQSFIKNGAITPAVFKELTK